MVMVDVIGTVTDADLASYTVEVARVGTNEFHQIGSGTSEVVNGKLATFDPTLLQRPEGWWD